MALFHPFRALGHVADDVPFAVQRRGSETFCTVSVGTAWQVYDTAKLTVVLIGPLLPGRITCLASSHDYTYAAVEGGNIIQCRRVHVTGALRAPRPGRVDAMLILGKTLLALGWGGLLCVWDLGNLSAPPKTIELDAGFVPTAMAHPDTYLNKIVIGSADGRLQLWNFSTGTKLHEFAPLGSAVNVITPSSALDIVGLGLADGRAVLINVRFDEIVAEFVNAAGAGAKSERLLKGAAGAACAGAGGAEACTALSFRAGPGLPLLVAGGAGGTMTVWDLERRRLHAVVPEAHDAGVTRAFFFPGEPRIMTAGRDNALKQWVLDAPANGGAVDGASTAPPPRLLRFRAGHAAPPSIVRHHGPGGLMLLSAGLDRTFRAFSTIRDARSHELSQRHVQRRAQQARAEASEIRLPRVTAMASCAARDRDWAGAITAHAGEPTAYTWRLQEGALGEHALTPPPLVRREKRRRDRLERRRDPNARREALPEVTAVGLSACGNFGLVGTADGRAHRFNVQSGIHRGECRRPGRGRDASAHDGPVTGVASDAANRFLATAGADGALRVWSFGGRGELLGEVALGARPERLAVHGASALAAVAGADHAIQVVDLEARRVVRRFAGHLDRITDLQFSDDCRWLLSSSMDGTLRVWDVPGAQVLQVLDLGGVVTSLSLSPGQDLLATTRADSRGIELWSNQLFYGAGVDIVPGSAKPVPVERPRLALDDGGAESGVDGKAAKAGFVRIAGLPLAKAAEESDEEEAAPDASALADLRESASSESDSDSEDDDKIRARASTPPLLLEQEVSRAAWSARLPESGAPAPLAPSMLTLSLLPRTQVQMLAHLDTVRARNAPQAPPKKPEAAPFFLPSLASEVNAGRNPVFVAAEGAEAPAEASRVTKLSDPLARGGRGSLVALLDAGASSGAVLGLLRALTPAGVDAEVRGLAGLATPERDAQLVAAFAEALLDLARAGVDFDLVQGLLRLTLEAHGALFLADERLGAVAKLMAEALRAGWKRIDRELAAARCVLGLLGNLQP